MTDYLDVWKDLNPKRIPSPSKEKVPPIQTNQVTAVLFGRLEHISEVILLAVIPQDQFDISVHEEYTLSFTITQIPQRWEVAYIVMYANFDTIPQALEVIHLDNTTISSGDTLTCYLTISSRDAYLTISSRDALTCYLRLGSQ